MTYSSDGLKVGRGLVLEKVRVGNPARLPDTLVGRVLDEGSRPLALVSGVLLRRLRPGAAAGNVIALGVRNHGWEKVAILLIIPVLRLLGVRIGDLQRLVLKPILRHSSVLVNNIDRSILVPVLRLGGLRVPDAGLVHPVGRLGVLRVVNFGRWGDWRVKVLKQAARLDLLSILLDGKSVVGIDNERVQLSRLDNLGRGRRAQMFLLVLARLGVLVVEDEVHLVGVAALVWTKHDDVGRRVGKLVLVESGILAEELQVGTSALKTIWQTGQLASKQ